MRRNTLRSDPSLACLSILLAVLAAGCAEPQPRWAAAAQVQSEAQFQDWRGWHEEKEDTIFQSETWTTSTTGHLIKRTGAVPDEFRAWLRVDCTPRWIDNVGDIIEPEIFFTHAVTTAKGDRRPKPTADGYVAKTWLVRLDSDRAEWMGFANLRASFRNLLLRTTGPGFTRLSPSREGVHPEMRTAFNRWWAWWREWLGSPEALGVESGLLHEEAGRRLAETARKIEDVRTLSLDDLKRAKRLHIEVGIRPEDEIEDIQLTNDNMTVGTAVIEFSLKGSARAIDWAERNCRKALERLAESTA